MAAVRRCSASAPLHIVLLAAQVVTVLAACHERPPPEVPLQGRWHTVAAGETLAQLAARYRVPLDDLVELNALADPDQIDPGTELFIPEVAPRPAPTTTVPSWRSAR